MDRFFFFYEEKKKEMLSNWLSVNFFDVRDCTPLE